MSRKAKNSVCNRDCLNCIHPDCILEEEPDALECWELEHAEKLLFLTAEERSKKNRSKAYYEANREKRLAYQTEYRKANKEKVAASQRASYAARRERRIAYQRAYYEEHRDEISARKRDRYLAKKRAEAERG